MKENKQRPAFIGHGSPMNLIEKNKYTSFLKNYASSILPPKCVVVISAHWLTEGTYITGGVKPGQIFDFYGFPDELYNIDYKPAGSINVVKAITELIPEIKADNKRGIDHAGWAVLKHMYPAQNIPVLEISLDINKTETEHFLLGQKLATFAAEGILLIGSGNLVHNLRDIDYKTNSAVFDWAVDADKWMKEKTENFLIDDLIDYKNKMPSFRKAIPTDDHFLPLLYILGAKPSEGKVKTIFEGIQNASISMRSLEIL